MRRRFCSRDGDPFIEKLLPLATRIALNLSRKCPSLRDDLISEARYALVVLVKEGKVDLRDLRRAVAYVKTRIYYHLVDFLRRESGRGFMRATSYYKNSKKGRFLRVLSVDSLENPENLRIMSTEEPLEELVERKLIMEKLAKALNDSLLTDRERIILEEILRGRSQKEIAQKLGTTPAIISKEKHRAIGKIRELLAVA